jgi:uncharacterized membrane protein required for colicin V production
MFDILAIVYIAINLYLGWKYGVFRRIMHVGAFFLGMLLAQAISVGFAQLLNYNTGKVPVSAHLLLYVGIVFAVVVFVEILGFAYAKSLQFMSGMIFDRFLGLAIALAAGALELTMLLFIFNLAINTQGPTGTAQMGVVTGMEEQVKSSPSAKQFERLLPTAKLIYAPVLPPQPDVYFTKSFS